MFNEVINTYSEILTRFRQETGQANAVLAGGCLRDTFFGVQVKDLDFVVECQQDVDRRGRPLYIRPISPWTRGLRNLWPDKRFQFCVGQDEYGFGAAEAETEMADRHNTPAGLLDVIESTDKAVNIILVKSIPQYTQQFPDSISQMVFDGNEVIVSNKWRDGHDMRRQPGRVYYRWDIKTPRLMKLKAKYPTWGFIPEAW